jgi:hypothetical protein
MTKATRKSKRVPLEFITGRDSSLPRYCERDHGNGNLSFRVGQGARVPLPGDRTTPEFHIAYNAALVDAFAMESDDE